MNTQPKGIAMLGIVGIILVVVAIAIGAYFMFSDSGSDPTNTNSVINTNSGANSNESMEDTSTTNEVMMEDTNTNEAAEDDAMMEENTNTQASAGEYTTYSSTKFAEASGKRRILFFYASWCPTCRPADANITANADKLPSDVVVLRTDYDNETALKEKYGITYQHTFVLVDENGNAIKKWNGGDIDEILAEVI